jgi:hypothetical protein
LNAIVTESLNSKVDACIAEARPFAQAILAPVRELVDPGCPRVEEMMK